MEKRTMGALMAALRKSKGMTQQDVADKLGVSNKTVSKWECDDGYPDISALPAIAQLYGITVDELLRGEVKNEEKETYKAAPNEKVISHFLSKAKNKYTNLSVLSITLFLLSCAISVIKNFYDLTSSGDIAMAAAALLLIAGGVVTQFLASSNFVLSLKDRELLKTEEKSKCFVLFKWFLFANSALFLMAVMLFVSIFVLRSNESFLSAGATLLYLVLCLVMLMIFTFVFKKRIYPEMSDELIKANIKKYFIGFAAVFLAVTLFVYCCYAVSNELSYEKFQLQSKEQITQLEEFLLGQKYIALDEILEDGENVYKSFPKTYDKELAVTVVDNCGDAAEDSIKGYRLYVCDSVIRGSYYSDEKYGGDIYFTTIIFTSKVQKDAFIDHCCVKDSSYLSKLKLAKLNEGFEIKYAGKDGLKLKYRDSYISMSDSALMSALIGVVAALVYSLIFLAFIQRKDCRKKHVDE